MLTTSGQDPEEGIRGEESDPEPEEPTIEEAGLIQKADLERAPELGQEGGGTEREHAPASKRRLRLSQWLTIAMIVAGLVCAIIGPTLHTASDTPAESDFTSWVRPAGLIVIVLGLAVLGLDILFQTEQVRAKKVAETPAVHIYGSGHRIALGDAFQQLPGVAASDTYMARQEQMLRDSYVQTISQAKVIFWVSLVFMCLGGLILLVGALSAVYSGGNSGKVEAGIVTAVSGALANLASATFLYQANKSRTGLADQAASMQARSIADRRITVVREVAADLEPGYDRTSSLKELMSALSRSIDRLDSHHTVASTESVTKPEDKKSKSKSGRARKVP